MTPGLRAVVTMEARRRERGGGAGPVSRRPSSRLLGVVPRGGALELERQNPTVHSSSTYTRAAILKVRSGEP